MKNTIDKLLEFQVSNLSGFEKYQLQKVTKIYGGNPSLDISNILQGKAS